MNKTNKVKTILFASLIAALILPFSGMNFAEAKQDPHLREKHPDVVEMEKNTSSHQKLVKKSAQDEKCIENIFKSMEQREKQIDKKLLKSETKNHTDFKIAKESRNINHKTDINYWTVDYDKCKITLDTIAVKYDLGKGTDNHEELIFEIDAKSNKINKSLIDKPSNISHSHNSQYSVDERKSLNWASIGQIEGNDDTNSDVSGAQAYHYVREVTDSRDPDCEEDKDQCILSVWVGLSEKWHGADTMIQTGVDSWCIDDYCQDGTSYNAWLERVDGGNSYNQDICTSTTIDAGDYVLSYVYNYGNTFYLGTMNLSNGQTCSTTVSESESMNYAQYVVERPYDNTSGEYYRLPDFVDFGMTSYIKANNSWEGMGDHYNIGDATLHDMTVDPSTSSADNVRTYPAYTDDVIWFNYRHSEGTQ